MSKPDTKLLSDVLATARKYIAESCARALEATKFEEARRLGGHTADILWMDESAEGELVRMENTKVFKAYIHEEHRCNYLENQNFFDQLFIDLENGRYGHKTYFDPDLDTLYIEKDFEVILELAETSDLPDRSNENSFRFKGTNSSKCIITRLENV